MNKGAWEGGIVTVTKIFCDRHLFSMRCLYHREIKEHFSTIGWNALGQRVIVLQFKHWVMLYSGFFLYHSWNEKK